MNNLYLIRNNQLKLTLNTAIHYTYMLLGYIYIHSGALFIINTYYFQLQIRKKKYLNTYLQWQFYLLYSQIIYMYCYQPLTYKIMYIIILCNHWNILLPIPCGISADTAVQRCHCTVNGTVQKIQNKKS